MNWRGSEAKEYVKEEANAEFKAEDISTRDHIQVNTRKGSSL